MTISIIIPAYNEEKYLPKTLESISKLERKPDEIIIVNASSTDKTADIARAFGAKVITAEKKTIGYSRQFGMTVNSPSRFISDLPRTLLEPWRAEVEEW